MVTTSSSELRTSDRRRIDQFDRRAQHRENGRDRRAAIGALRRFSRPTTQEPGGTESVERVAVQHDARALGFSKRRPGARIIWASGSTFLERSVGDAVNVTLQHMFET